jgi:CBS domain-containing protein
MNVRELYTRNTVSVQTGDDVVTAARLMREKHVGSVVVVEAVPGMNIRRPVGILTDRDIVVTVVAPNANPNEFKVSDVMTPWPVAVKEDDTLSVALGHMRRLGVRRLPVIDDHGSLVGILSLDDVLAGMSGDLQDVADLIANERRMESRARP